MDSILPLFLQLVAGGLSANGLAQLMKKFDLDTISNTIAGAAGGLGGSAIAATIVGHRLFDQIGLFGDCITGAVGGLCGFLIFGYAQKAISADNND